MSPTNRERRDELVLGHKHAELGVSAGQRERVVGPTSSFDLAFARLKHITWKLHLRSYIHGEAAIGERELVSHTDCEFGRWLARMARERMDLPDVEQLVDVHSRVHAIAREIVRNRGLGNQQACQADLLLVDPLSARLIALIDRLESFMQAEALAKRRRVVKYDSTTALEPSAGQPGIPV